MMSRTSVSAYVSESLGMASCFFFGVLFFDAPITRALGYFYLLRPVPLHSVRILKWELHPDHLGFVYLLPQDFRLWVEVSFYGSSNGLFVMVSEGRVSEVVSLDGLTFVPSNSRRDSRFSVSLDSDSLGF
ncbi:hypothetical protein A2U01_0007734 [Trifolium medium]|uniref:Uncharacterized protein n=1 Tax=Trifolium medium TaxID=97028 RepID=A0A392MKT0_9FABA|nr:hypothetical protein [Trifolium medium]